MRPNPDSPDSASRRAANIFINYRRGDSAGHAGRLFDRLSSRFPKRVFMDVDTIEPGIDFVDVINQAVGSCEVLIVMIGREWLFLTDASGQRRLDDPSDFVRLEIAAALERNIRIIPVLVEGAPMPRAEDLPADLAKLTRRNAIELSDGRFNFDVDRLVQAIEVVLQDRAPSALLPAMTAPLPPTPAPAGLLSASRPWLALSAVLLLALVGWLGGSLGLQPSARQNVETVSWDGPVESAADAPQSPPLPPADQEAAPEKAATGSTEDTVTVETATRKPVQETAAPRPDGSKPRKGGWRGWVERKKDALKSRIRD